MTRWIVTASFTVDMREEQFMTVDYTVDTEEEARKFAGILQQNNADIMKLDPHHQQGRVLIRLMPTTD